ncbi:acyl-CoA dehydrogenase family protein [Cryptosporangium aurantiacum]|uniref:Acyl-CoA dehydrogenase n=1 Tax=Cryptosporangium aurantiacum TaxID=134849 RepID=A0A1M7PGW6_9ACTN|nr:acyl-CoA dehydrogenase family protein [Cryptosporangium aurantiacum]SHN16295.1 acyl-CoA dehydrogenase [Cryptosporangium aurantiacum]
MSGLTAEQQELRSMIRALLEKQSPESAVRATMDTDRGYDPALWTSFAELGLLSLAVPETFGGGGAGWTEQGLVFEELGRSLACAPYLSTVGLAITALLESGDDRAIERWLPSLAAGDRTAALVLGERSGHWSTTGEALTATATDGGWQVTGVAEHVLDGATADLLLVLAVADPGPTLFAVEAAGQDVRRTPVTTSDRTRRIAHVRLLDAAARPIGAIGGGADIVAAALRYGQVALACEQVGGAARCLELAVDYAKTRVQFGRPIGSFQAVKHKCADMLVAVESARSASWVAIRAAGSEDLPLAAAVAAAVCAEAYEHCASVLVQVSGGIGYTWEHPAHLHVKRSRGSAVLLGAPHQHRRLVAELASIPAAHVREGSH